jgi:hypothetical protein
MQQPPPEGRVWAGGIHDAGCLIGPSRPADAHTTQHGEEPSDLPIHQSHRSRVDVSTTFRIISAAYAQSWRNGKF